MRILHDVALQENHAYLKENLHVDPVLEALYGKRIFCQADYDRCREAAPGRQCEVFLETLKKKGVEEYKAFCVALDASQPFIKERLDVAANEEGDIDLVYANMDKVEARYKKELAERDGEIADLCSSVQRLEGQIKQMSLDYAELEETIKKERDEHRSQIQKQNEETEACAVDHVNMHEVEAREKELAEKDGKIVDFHSSVQSKQTSMDSAELEQAAEEERGEHRQTEKPNEEAETHSPEGRCQFSTVSCCDERQLRLLPCLHSACKPCLDHQAIQAEEKRIHCPYCGRLFTMEQTTVDHVRRNEAAYKVNTDGEMKCKYTEHDHPAPAVMYCHECDEKLCSDCHKLHDKLKQNRNHSIIEISQAGNIPFKHWLKQFDCRDHPDNRLQLYDHTCKKTICLVCVHGVHKDHTIEELNQAYEAAKDQLQDQVQRQHFKLKDVTDRMKTVTSHQTELDNTQRRLEEDATKVYTRVAAKFQHRQRQLKEEVQVSLQFPYKMAEEKLDTLHDVHASIVSTIDYIQRTLEFTRREELITLTDVLHRKCEDNLKRKLPEDNTQDTRILLTFQGQRALEELIDTFGTLVSSLKMDQIPDSQPTLQDLLTMMWRERGTIMSLQELIKQQSLDHAELEEAIMKEKEEHRLQIEKKNEEAEALKMQLSKLNKDLQHSRENCEKLEQSVLRLQEQIKQKSLDNAEQKEIIKKEREEHRIQLEKKNEEAEALKMQLSKLNKDLQHSKENCEKLEQSVLRLQEQIKQKSQDNAEQKEIIKKEKEEHRIQIEKKNEEAEACKMQLNQDLQTSRAKCEKIEKMHEGRWQQLQQIIHRIPELKVSDSRMARSQEPEMLTSEEVWRNVGNLVIGACILHETIPHGKTLKGYGTLHTIRDDHSFKFIICPKLQLDAARANKMMCHVTGDGVLVNSPPDTQHTGSGRLRELRGTCSSTPIPLPPTTPAPHTPRYWETHTSVGLVSKYHWDLLEMGVGEESQVDSEGRVRWQCRSWCISVDSCRTHPGSLCTRVYRAGREGEHYSNTMSDKPGTQATLHHGVVLDVGRGRIGFIDLDRSAVLGKVDVEFKEDLLPVFTVHPFRDLTVNMKVVSGEEIVMSDTKKALINEALS